MESFDKMDDEGFVVRIRGLPWSASNDEVSNFLEGCNIINGNEGIHFTYVRDGRPSGEAYIELETEEDLEKALSRDKHHMGKRYIEVFRSKKSEMDWVVKRSGPNQPEHGGGDAVVRLRGLPFGCSKEEIAHFFSGMEIVPNGITLLTDHQGRTTGDAYVQFAGQDIAEKAQLKHKERIGHRYIEIFKSSMSEQRNALVPRMGRGLMSLGMGGRPGPYDRTDRFGGGGGMGLGGGLGYGRGGRARGNIKGCDTSTGYFDDGFDDFGGGYGGSGYGSRGGGLMGRRGMGMGSSGMGMGGGMGAGRGRFGSGGGGMGGGMGGSSSFAKNYISQTGHSVHMRGLPFAATEQDILDFFKPLNPVNVVIHYNNDGRASGEADVDYATHEEAKEAMEKDRSSMQHRYIELFLKSTLGGRNGGNGFGGSGGGRSNFGGNNTFSNNDGYGMGGGSGGMGGGGMGSGMGMNDSFGSGTGSGYGGGYGSGNNSNFGGNSMGGGYGSSSMGNPNYTAF